MRLFSAKVSKKRETPKYLTNFTANIELMTRSGYRCGKDIDIAAILQPETLAEVGYRHRKIPDGDIGAVDTSQCSLQIALVHRGETVDPEPTAREVNNLRFGDEQMTVAVKLGNTIATCYLIETARLHQRGVRFIEVVNSG